MVEDVEVDHTVKVVNVRNKHVLLPVPNQILQRQLSQRECMRTLVSKDGAEEKEVTL